MSMVCSWKSPDNSSSAGETGLPQEEDFQFILLGLTIYHDAHVYTKVVKGL